MWGQHLGRGWLGRQHLGSVLLGWQHLGHVLLGWQHLGCVLLGLQRGRGAGAGGRRSRVVLGVRVVVLWVVMQR